MRKNNYEVMAKILFAVETGGQVYGHERYDCIIGAGHNTPNERAITIGAAGWYANNAKKLLNLIRSEYPNKFRALDVANIASDLDNRNWSTYNIPIPSSKSRCIQSIISCQEGINCQHILMISDIENYEKNIIASHGNMCDSAMMECVNIVHQGGGKALNRILAKTNRPLTHHSIYAALKTDQNDHSNNNQVGDYVTRQKKVYEMICTYCDKGDENTMGRTAEDVLNVMRSWIGRNEANGGHKYIIDLYNSVKPLPRGYAVKYSDEWCDTTVSAAGIQAGCSDLIGRECGCEEHIKIFKKMGIWVEDGRIVPEPGYIILYNWDDRTQPNDGHADHIGFVDKVVGRTIFVIEGNNNCAVARRTINIGDGFIRGYATPRYEKNEGSVPFKTSNVKTGAKGLVTISELNVRKTPASTDSPVKTLPKGAAIYPTERTVGRNQLKDYWFKYSDGWVCGSYLDGWVFDMDSSKWWYIKDGKTLNLTWSLIDGNWFYFDETGYMVTGWKFINGAWYFFDDNGLMKTGWQFVDNKWYYMKPDGAMVSNKYIKKKDAYVFYWVNARGEYEPKNKVDIDAWGVEEES